MFDKQNLISDAQAITATAVGTNVIRLDGKNANGGAQITTDTLGNTMDNDLAKSPEVDILITVTEAFTAAGAATLTISLEADDDSAQGSATTLATTAAIGKATLIPGYQVRLSLPPGIAAADLHLGLRYTVATGPMTAGKITAGIVHRSTGKPTAPGVFK
jgi:hypothetical protein